MRPTWPGPASGVSALPASVIASNSKRMFRSTCSSAIVFSVFSICRRGVGVMLNPLGSHTYIRAGRGGPAPRVPLLPWGPPLPTCSMLMPQWRRCLSRWGSVTMSSSSGA